MWAVAVESSRTLEKILFSVKPTVPYAVSTSGTGATIAVSPNAAHPHFFLLDANPELSKHAISWVHKNLHPQVLISSGLTDDWRVAPNEQLEFLPYSCLRSAGRIDMGGGPVLFEEIPFDPWVQSALAKSAHAPATVGTNLKLFGSDRAVAKAGEKQWLSSHLECQSYDTYSGELLLAGKRLGLRIGCLKHFDSSETSLGSVVDFWSGFRIPV